MASRSRRRILVVNPNSNEVVTKGLADALAPIAFEDGPEIDCVTLKEGPYGIETQEHVESVALPLRRLVAGSNDVDAFVIACYSDPGLHVCREATPRPVFGINEAGVLTALARGERFGVIAIGQRSIRRHVRYMRQMGLMDRFAGERPLNMSVAETASGEKTLDRMIEVGKELRDAGWRRRHRHGLRRHGPPPPAAGSGARRAGDRPDAGGRRHGARRRAVRSGLSLAASGSPLGIARCA